jgi:uncharacterized protein
MNTGTLHSSIEGPAGTLVCAIDRPTTDAFAAGPLALLCHPHPLHGGTMDNKVVQTMARALLQRGCTVVRFNFRGVGGSAGTWDHGQGEVDDAAAVLAAHHQPQQPLLLGGFSFGGFVATQLAARRVAAGNQPEARLVLVAPAVQNFKAAPVPPGSVLVHGETDDVVPLHAVLDWARPQQLPVTVLPGAGHFFHGQLLALKQIVLNAYPALVAPP